VTVFGMSAIHHALIFCEVGEELYARMMLKLNAGHLAEVEHRELVTHRKGCAICSKEGIEGMIHTVECDCGKIATFEDLKWKCPDCGREWGFDSKGHQKKLSDEVEQ